MLFELALHQVAPVGAERVRQHLEAIVFLDDIDHQVRRQPGVRGEIFVESGEAGFVVLEGRAIHELAATAQRRRHLNRRDADEDLVSHLSDA